jgi:hypothetical protein
MNERRLSFLMANANDANRGCDTWRAEVQILRKLGWIPVSERPSRMNAAFLLARGRCIHAAGDPLFIHD